VFILHYIKDKQYGYSRKSIQQKISRAYVSCFVIFVSKLHARWAKYDPWAQLFAPLCGNNALTEMQSYATTEISPCTTAISSAVLASHYSPDAFTY